MVCCVRISNQTFLQSNHILSIVDAIALVTIGLHFADVEARALTTPIRVHKEWTGSGRVIIMLGRWMHTCFKGTMVPCCNTLTGLSEQNLVYCDHHCMTYDGQQSCDHGCKASIWKLCPLADAVPILVD
ncbi:hypothetical protein DFA_10905 [Cavenderia fasciculata]|uniref:Uncharacterized protein n=1 Tax=Cavenderia fasciculata TaxID=261658 RepID=F4QBQ9_CACFS|nr:uncharacterized protein DFA_10905 [Cavenderia fasciculata]EGG14647.1 hypothetical protein DFA_10905 [Cavenderia fasciculata]|eukprot:XP_004351155.1 hypothetical protein DFA_10905 [Cavenderia fasciculata]